MLLRVIFTLWYNNNEALINANLDRRTLSTMTYNTFYELIQGNGRRKKYRKRSQRQNGEGLEADEMPDYEEEGDP